MELTQIRYFMAVAQCENMSRAAEQCHVSQPSLSKSISKLESEIGCELFDRAGKHITLNENGRRFLRGASSMVWELDNTIYDVRQMAHKAVSHINVGLVSSTSEIENALCEYALTCPEVRLDIETSRDRLESVDINQYDMLVYPDNSRYKKLKGQVIGQEEYLFTFGHRYSDAAALSTCVKDGRIDTQALDNQSFVFLRYTPDHVEFAWDVCTRLGIHTHARAFTDSLAMHRRLIEDGCACGFIERREIGGFTDGAVVTATPTRGNFKRDILLCFKRAKRLSATGLEFKNFVLEHIDK